MMITTFAAVTLLVILIAVISVPIIGFYFFCNYKLFEKCGVEGWKGLIPFYNKYIMIRIAGLHWWYIIMYIISIFLFIDGKTGIKILCILVLIFFNSVVSYNFCKKVNNGKNPLLLDFILLTFVPLIYVPIMALNDKYVYHDNVDITPNGYIDEIQTSNFKNQDDKKKTNNKKKYCEKCGEPLALKDVYCPHCGKKI